MELDIIKLHSMSIRTPNLDNISMKYDNSPYLATDSDFHPIYNKKWKRIGLKYIGSASNVIVPETYDGELLTNVSYMFDDNQDVVSVEFPKTVKTAVAACRNCANLKNITFNSDIINMKEICYGCVSLTTINNLPDSCTNLNDAFTYCISLRRLPNLPANLKYANRLCYYCLSLEGIDGEFPPNLEELAFGFYGCSKLNSLPAFPEPLWNIESVCEGCSNLHGEIVINNQLPAFENCLKGAGISTKDSITLRGTSFNLFSISKTDPDKEMKIQQEDYYSHIKPISEEITEKANYISDLATAKVNNIKKKLYERLVHSEHIPVGSKTIFK